MIAKSDNRILWLPGEERMWDDEPSSRSNAGVRIDSSNAHSVAAVFACLRVIAETVASLPLHVLERTAGGGKRIARELPLYRQLHSQPNAWQTSFEWREQAVFHVGLWGDAFSELKAGEIQPLHPSRMKIERLENGRLRYKYREQSGTESVYANEQILQIRGPSDDGVNGLRIVEECKDAIALARACELHGARFFAAGARPGFVLSTDGQLNAEAREALRSQWDRRHGGVGNSHNTAVLTGGLKPYEIPQINNNDAQFLELRRYQLEEIARLFRCPGWLLGIGTSTPQSEMEFVTHTILPWLRRFESACQRDLIEDDDRYHIEFDIRGLLRGDSASRSAYYRSMWDIGVLSTDDIRELENMDPVDGGDVRYRPLNMGTLGAPPSVEDVLAQQQPGSGIDGQAVEGGVAAAAGEAAPAPAPEPADTSLTTAEVSSLLTVVKQITDGLLSIDAARAIIAAAFPVLSAARVETILQGVQSPKPESLVPTETSQRDCGTGAGGFKPGNKCAGSGGGGSQKTHTDIAELGFSVSESISQAHPDVVGEMHTTLQKLKEDYPGVESSISVIRSEKLNDGVPFTLRLREGVASLLIDTDQLSGDKIEKTLRDIEKAQSSGFLASRGGLRGIIEHELAHAIDKAPFRLKQNWSGISAAKQYIKNNPPSAKNLSRYALQGGVNQKEEMWAEAFAAWRTNPDPNEWQRGFNAAITKQTTAPKRSLPESRAMTVSIDFDRTFAADPPLWGEFARKAVADGNTVVMISRRPDTPEDRQTVTDTLGEYAEAFSQVLLVGGGTLKADAAEAAGVNVDVWVDDSPQTIKSRDADGEV